MRSDPTSVRCANLWRAKLVKPGLVLLVAGLLPAMGSGAAGVVQAQEDRPASGRLEAVSGEGVRPAGEAQGDYILGSEDLLEIDVVGVESVSRTVRVSEAGEITLPLLGEVKVAGMTRSAVERTLADLLKERYVHNPQVSVFVKEYGSRMVSVLGAVENPGRYPMTGRRTLLDMLSAAGGLTDEAGPTAIITHQPLTPDAVPETVRVDIHALLYDGKAEMNPEIGQGDLIHVPVDLPVRVYVHGAVNSPGELETRLSRPLTVLQAITKAGGATERAALKKVELLRFRPDGSKETIHLDVKAILQGRAEDVLLQDADVIHVPETYF